MIRHVWSVLCQSASIDAQTNNVSLFNALENIIVLGELSKEKPFILSCEIVSLWAREHEDKPASGQLRACFISPEGRNPQSIVLDIDLTKTPFHRTRLTIGALPVISTGWFEFVIDFRLAGEENWRPAARLPFLLSTQSVESLVNHHK